MKRILFVVIPEKGHIHPYLGPAARLRQRGHDVAFYAEHDVSAQLRAAGFDQSFAGREGSAPPQTSRGAAFAERVRDRSWLRGWIKALLLDAVPSQVEALRAVLRRFRPDVLAIDPMVYAAAIAAALEGVPWAGLSSSLNPVVPADTDSELIATNRWLSAERDALFARYGLVGRFRVCDCLSPQLNIVFSTEEFVGGPVASVHLVGPSLPVGPRGDECDFPWSWLRADVPLVYLSLGSQIFYQPRRFRTVIDAVRGRPVQLVLSAGDLAGSPVLGPLPDNVLAVPYAPQLQLLQRAAVLVTHGGANSVMEALAFGVPLLVTPICNDQPHNAAFVERSGVGLALDLEAVSAAACWQALSALLGPGRYRDCVARVHASYRTRDGAAESARLLEALAG
jgi:MGT family glycosyltransferase